MKKAVTISVILLLVSGFSGCKNKYTKTGSVERLSPIMDDIIKPGVLPEIIADSFEWSEGPVWVPELEAVLFSDIPHNSVFQWTEKDGLELYLKPSGYTDTIRRGGETGSNGLLLDPNDRLVLCQHGDRKMARMDAPLSDPQPDYVTLADNWDGKRFNSPNDAVFSSNGDLYFTDPAYGMELRWDDPKREMNFAGVFRLAPDGHVSLLLDSIARPNGLGLSPDESRFYLASSGIDASLYEYSISKDGTLTEGKLFFSARELKKSRKGSCDGMTVRSDGIIFATGPGGVLVLDPDGNHLGSILTGQATSNCTLDSDGSWLYMTADMYLMRIKLK
ncbi:MAG TPA: SMP-30/gluconolactonase/LRE family protein [Bacteroides sp.]|nr:SMP-30/gluconolactonase/LRE family protein [Bacteroides sp.]